jgi:hypothetical protein
MIRSQPVHGLVAPLKVCIGNSTYPTNELSIDHTYVSYMCTYMAENMNLGSQVFAIWHFKIVTLRFHPAVVIFLGTSMWSLNTLQR